MTRTELIEALRAECKFNREATGEASAVTIHINGMTIYFKAISKILLSDLSVNIFIKDENGFDKLFMFIFYSDIVKAGR